MSKNDGTLRFFLSLSDEADDGQSSEDLAKIAKVEPSGNVTILEDDGFQNMPLGIVEQKLGVDPLSEDNEEQLKILAFIKKQTSYGEEFRNKFRNFPEEFYEAIDHPYLLRAELIHSTFAVTSVETQNLVGRN